MKKRYRVDATAQWHVHVGGGDEHKLDPLGYVVKETENGRWFYRIDVAEMMETDSHFAAEFVKITEGNNALYRLRKLIFDAFNPAISSTWTHRAHVSDSFYETYRKKINDFELKNQLIVQCLPFAAGRAYIPGSSIKGAIRTAVLDALAKKNGYDNTLREVKNRLPHKKDLTSSKEVEKYLLQYSKIQEDPFKAIKVTDATLPADSTQIVEVKNVPKDSDPLSLDLFVEAVKPKTEFTFFISSEDKSGMNGIDIKKFGLTIEKIMESCKDYYMNAINEEAEKFYPMDSPADKKVQNALSAVLDDDSNPIPGVSIIRIGRFSHLESMTYSERGEGKLCQPKPYDHRTHQSKPWGTTRNLVNGKFPLGVVSLIYTEVN